MTNLEVKDITDRKGYFLSYILPFFVVAAVFGFFTVMVHLSVNATKVGFSESGAMVTQLPIPIYIKTMLIVGGGLASLALAGFNLYRAWLFSKNLPDEYFDLSLKITVTGFVVIVLYIVLKFGVLTQVNCGFAGCEPF